MTKIFSIVGRGEHYMFYINDRFVKEEEATISVLDLGLLRGYGVFDYLRTYRGRPFHLKEHLDRLAFSAEQLGLSLPKSLDEIEAIVRELLRINNYPESSVKIVVTGGESPDQFLPKNRPTLIALVYPLQPFPSTFYEHGIGAATTTLARSLPTSKTIHYIPAIVALKNSAHPATQEILYISDKGKVLEASTSNFFAIRGNQLLTPPGDGVLLGITRAVVLRLAESLFDVVERPIPRTELAEIEEAFLSASSKELLPLITIDSLPVGKGVVGPKTRLLMQLFEQYTQGEVWPELMIPRYKA